MSLVRVRGFLELPLKAARIPRLARMLARQRLVARGQVAEPMSAK
jgi:hypothetical protein